MRSTALRIFPLAPVLWLALVSAMAFVSAPAAAQFVEGPYVDRLTPGSATVHVRTRSPLEVSVRFESAGVVLERTSAPATMHRIVVSGLPDDARVDYVVRADGREARGHFRTAPAVVRPVSFVALGDCRDGDEEHATVLSRIGADPDFLLHLGDMVPRGALESEWETFFGVARPVLARTAIVPVLGNHEIISPPGPRMVRDRFAFPRGPDAYYTFDFAGIRIIVLDSNDSLEVGSPQHDFALRELERARSASPAALFVALHHGPYSSGRHGNLEVAHDSGLVDVMKQAGVDLVFSGHDHIYERGDADGLKYVVTGGCGSPLYRANDNLPSQQRFAAVHHYVRVEVSDGEVNLRTTRSDGTILEQCRFARGGRWDCSARGPELSVDAAPRPEEDGVTREEDSARRWLPAIVIATVLALVIVAFRRWRRSRP